MYSKTPHDRPPKMQQKVVLNEGWPLTRGVLNIILSHERVVPHERTLKRGFAGLQNYFFTCVVMLITLIMACREVQRGCQSLNHAHLEVQFLKSSKYHNAINLITSGPQTEYNPL